MKLVVAKEIGYCYGVDDAIEDVVNASKNLDKGHKMYTYGPLIHNVEAIGELKEKYNISSIEEATQIPDQSTLAIRAHGIAPKTLETFLAKDVQVIDATCPFVKKTHKIARRLVEEGYFVIILGKKKHPEVIGIAGHVETQCLVVEKEQDLEGFKRKRKIGIVFQSTIMIADFEHLIPKILNFSKEVKIHPTICDVTIKRQKEALEIANQVQYMVVIGGKNSSNTMKLVQLCRSQHVCTVQLEKASEVQYLDFKGIEAIGVTTGTSTPQKTIDEILEAIKNKGEKDHQNHKNNVPVQELKAGAPV